MDCGESRGHDPGFRRIVEAAEPYILRHRKPHRLKYPQSVQSHKIIGAQKYFRQIFLVMETGCQIFLIILSVGIPDVQPVADDTVLFSAGKSQKVHGIPVSHISFEKGLAMHTFSDKADFLFATTDQLTDQDGDVQSADHGSILPVEQF